MSWRTEVMDSRLMANALTPNVEMRNIFEQDHFPESVANSWVWQTLVSTLWGRVLDS